MKSLFSRIASLQSESSHKKVLEASQDLLAIIPNDLAANKTHLVALIKLKQFPEALTFLSKAPHKDSFIFEHAYVLHRNGDNKEALQKLKGYSQQDSLECKHLMSQINYKLSEYSKCVKAYQDILEGSNDQDEVADILTNYLACQSNNLEAKSQDIEKFIQRYGEGNFEKTYEFYFNLSQVYLKD